jgi:WD40 repeat protein
LGIGGKMTEGKLGIEVLDLLNQSTVSAIPISDDGIYGVAFIGDGSRLAVCGHTRVRLYDYKKKRMVFEFPEPEDKPKKKDDEFVPLVGLPSKIFVENSGSFASIGPRVILNMAYHDATSVMAIANFSAVSFWDVNTGKLKWTTAIEGFRIAALSFSGDGSKLAVAHDEGRLTILDLAAVQR